MKNLLLTAVATVGLTAATMAQVPSYVPTNGLVGWWPFNGNANDESGNGNNGTVNGATLTNDRFGNANKAYNFDGVNDYIDIGNPLELGNNPSSYTQAGWAFYEDFLDGYVFMSKRHDNAGTDWATPVTTVQNTIRFFADDQFYTTAPVAESGILNVNEWYHFAFVKSNNTYTIYVNGAEISSINDSHVMGGSPYNMIFGAQLAWPEFMKGKLDDLAIWNRGLTQQEITALYNGCQLAVNTQPTSQLININNTASFVVGSSDPNASYQWQTDLGVGFQNLTGVGQYAGATTNTLTVSNVTMSNNNQPFRCIVSSGTCADTSDVAVLTVNNNASIDALSEDKLVTVYPNPAQDQLHVKTGIELMNASYSILDNTGRTVLIGQLSSENTVIELCGLSNGTYFLHVGDQLKESFKVVKNQ